MIKIICPECGSGRIEEKNGRYECKKCEFSAYQYDIFQFNTIEIENEIIYKFTPEVYTELYNCMIRKEVQTLFLKKYIITEIKTIGDQIIVKIEEVKI